MAHCRPNRCNGNMRTVLILAAVAAAVLTIPSAAMAATVSRPPSVSGQTVAAKPTVSTRASRFGRVLTDGHGVTLYLFTKDGRGPSRCYGTCARAWPPLLAGTGNLTATGGATARLGTTRRSNGARQVTYDGKPVYHYVGESRAGQIFCQDVVEFGGRWLIVAPGGRAIR